MNTTYMILTCAIIAEVIATSALARSDGFGRLVPSLIAIVGYSLALWLLSIVLRTVPAGVAYAIWSGLGVVLIALVAWLWYRQPLDLPAIIGIGLIMSGVVVINLFSRTSGH